LQGALTIATAHLPVNNTAIDRVVQIVWICQCLSPFRTISDGPWKPMICHPTHPVETPILPWAKLLPSFTHFSAEHSTLLGCVLSLFYHCSVIGISIKPFGNREQA
jgi:hypothetical protein